MITLKDVSKSYTEGAPALSDINIQIDEGEFVFVVGDSGSGKSTLIKLLLKELEPTSGTIVINDKILSQIPMFASSAGTKLPKECGLCVPGFPSVKGSKCL